MSLEARWRRVISGEARGLLPSCARAGLSALGGLYRLGLNANLAVYALGWPHSRPALPVISVGNLTVGGTGKSTAVRFLARELLALGLRPGVVLRGHRREGGAEVELASDGRGNLATVSECGDEAAEVARALPQVPVAVGKRRERAIALLAEHGAQVALLDDGYQYFRMSRELNIALVSAGLDLRTAFVLPRGVLREPWSHLRRADQVWLTHADLAAPEQLTAIRALVAKHAPKAPIVVTRHQPVELLTLADGQAVGLGELAGRKVLAVSGLGSPESFEGSLASLGAQVVPMRFADHHRYSPDDWQRIALAAEQAGADLVVTTEKDAVKLPAAPLPVHVLHSELAIIENLPAVTAALAALREKTLDA
jgi:tetraacyldisaccharide 4'-kinase